jgi:hypothetical protein
MRRPQFTLKTMLWLVSVVAITCASVKAVQKLYRLRSIATVRAQIEECREQRKDARGEEQLVLLFQEAELRRQLKELEDGN